MAQAFVTGPCYFYVGLLNNPLGGNPATGAGYTPTFLGTCEKTPECLIRPQYTDVFNDIMGQSIPYDKCFEGEDALILGDFTRYNEAVFAALQNRPFPVNVDRGYIPPGGIGTMMKTEGLTFPLWLTFPYVTKPAYATMPAGYHFLACTLEGPDRLSNLGTLARKTGMAFYAGPVLIPTSGGVAQRLYDTLPASFVGLPAVN